MSGPKNTLAGLLFLFLGLPAIQAQNQALALLEKAGEAYNKTSGVHAEFSIEVFEFGGESAAQIQGQIQLKGDKFKLDVGEMITWFDGKNQWFYLVNIQEVNLSNPAPEDLIMINPVMVFQLYKYGFDARYAGEKKLGTKIAQHVELIPQEQHSDIQRIEVWFDKQTHRPLRISIRNKDLSGSLINIDKYIIDQEYPDAMFVFQQKAYPGAVVIDLR
ncbi:MAG: LolA-like putative outer membrane lipoprotein chaperone [Bacteroidales bacterium]|nr:LolA-like putative outer membrane lipoprotein chaperone [Bacteroidales bacterium]MDD4641367.1 LolA-like putative outer membrane lipoprotein chaperone [Bacteroidales bacterium]